MLSLRRSRFQSVRSWGMSPTRSGPIYLSSVPFHKIQNIDSHTHHLGSFPKARAYVRPGDGIKHGVVHNKNTNVCKLFYVPCTVYKMSGTALAELLTRWKEWRAEGGRGDSLGTQDAKVVIKKRTVNVKECQRTLMSTISRSFEMYPP